MIYNDYDYNSYKYNNITQNIDYEELKEHKRIEELLSKFKDFKKETDEDILNKIDIKVIEKYLRKKKLENLEKLK